MIHDDKIIAGEALVKAVELEKHTKLPRIEVAQEVIELLDESGNPVVTDSIKEALEEIDGRWFVKTLDLHVGYWRDHNWYLQQQGKEQEDIPAVLGRIRTTLDAENKKVIEEDNSCAIEKWNWFMSQFEDAFRKGNWPQIEGAYDAACKIKR